MLFLLVAGAETSIIDALSRDINATMPFNGRASLAGLTCYEDIQPSYIV